MKCTLVNRLRCYLQNNFRKDIIIQRKQAGKNKKKQQDDSSSCRQNWTIPPF